MSKIEPYIVDILCKSVHESSPFEACHVTACAIASSEEEATVIIQDQLVSRSYMVKSVVSVSAKRTLPLGNSTEDELQRKALLSPDLYSLVLLPMNRADISKEYKNQFQNISLKMDS